MKAKYVHLALASLVLASCGAPSSPVSSPSSATPVILAHDKAKTIENILAAKTYRLDNFAHIESESSAPAGSSAPSTKIASIVENHSYFEVHNNDGAYWQESNTATRMKLSDYLAQAGMTLEQFKAMLPRMEAEGMKFVIDEKNDLLTMTLGSFDFLNYKTYVFYNADLKQYERYVYAPDKEGGEICTFNAYLLNRETGILEAPMGVNELVLYALNQGTFNPTECSYTIKDLDAAELTPMLQEGLGSFTKGLTLTIKDNYPEKMLLDIDFEAFDMMMDIPETATITASEYGIAFDYKGPFLDWTGKRAGIECESQHHGHAQYDYYEDGYRPYCPSCNKYLAEKQDYAFDSVYHVCEKSGRVDGLGLDKEKSYAGLIYADEEEGIEYYAFGFENNEKYGNKWYATTFEAKRIKEDAREDIEIYTHFDEAATYRYWPEQKALVVEKQIGDDSIGNSCRKVVKSNLSFYKNVEINMELLQEENEWQLSNGTALTEALESMTPAESIETLTPIEHHENLRRVTYEGEGCGVIHVAICDDCGEEVEANVRPTNHTFEYGEILSYADFSALLIEMEASNQWEESEIALIVKATCTECESVVLYVITPEYADDGYYWMSYEDEWGNFSFISIDDPLPNLNDAEGRPIFPIVD
ncbi:MAG: hypothetical protein SPL80_02865 [Bacilli bacterium]|nr:hypothetical protein [Bacilli bacterium]